MLVDGREGRERGDTRASVFRACKHVRAVHSLVLTLLLLLDPRERERERERERGRSTATLVDSHTHTHTRVGVHLSDGRACTYFHVGVGVYIYMCVYICMYVYNIQVWNSQTGELYHTLRGHATEIVCLSFNPQGTIIATGCVSKT